MLFAKALPNVSKASSSFTLINRIASVHNHLVSTSPLTATAPPAAAAKMSSSSTSSSASLSPTVKMADGHTIPRFGIGAWEMRGKETVDALRSAVEQVGYRHIDTAQYYRNESETGTFARSSSVPRSELFLTTKTFSKGSSAYDSILRSLSAAQLEYWDLVLIHAPDGGPKARRETWEALSRLVKEGKVRSLGVSNYGEKHLEELVQSRPEVLPVVNQIECHPFFAQAALRAKCASHNILVQAYCPLARGNYYGDSTLSRIASTTAKTEAQAMLRWSLQSGMIPLPKSSNLGRQKENWDAFAGGWELSEGDMKELDELDRGARGAVESQTMSQECA